MLVFVIVMLFFVLFLVLLVVIVFGCDNVDECVPCCCRLGAPCDPDGDLCCGVTG